MINRDMRDYEVSIWTLQDSFITVLEHSGLENKGRILEPRMILKDDGTQEFSFKVPMYLFQNNEKVENPIWYNTRNGIIMANMRKIKVIINKHKSNLNFFHLNDDVLNDISVVLADDLDKLENNIPERVFEFIITNVEEVHEQDSLYCYVKCEGLAFHELGKIGYKISLSSDDFYEEYDNWFKGIGSEWEDKDDAYVTISAELKNAHFRCLARNKETGDYIIPQVDLLTDDEPFSGEEITFFLLDTKVSGRIGKHYELDVSFYLDTNKYDLQWQVCYPPKIEPQATLQYWNDKIFKHVKNWTYEVVMDWSAYSGSGVRQTNKVYEDDYVSDWDDDLAPTDIESYKEKWRLVDLQESNVYNLTQSLAEKFGVFCKYQYEYDDNYHIIGRKVIYYNNFVQEQFGALDLTYPYSASSITRTMDSTDIISKMYVKPVTSNLSENNLISIMNLSVNKSGEDYLLNFDYLYSIGAISKEQYAEIKKYEKSMKVLNNKLIPLEHQIVNLEDKISKLESEQSLAKKSMNEDSDKQEKAQNLLNNLTNDTGYLDVGQGNNIIVNYKGQVTSSRAQGGQELINYGKYINSDYKTLLKRGAMICVSCRVKGTNVAHLQNGRVAGINTRIVYNSDSSLDLGAWYNFNTNVSNFDTRVYSDFQILKDDVQTLVCAGYHWAGAGTIEISEPKIAIINTPETAILRKDNSSNSDYSYYINLTKQGILPDSLHIFREKNSLLKSLSSEIQTGKLEYDEFGNLNKVSNLYKTNDSNYVYLVYSYQPKLYYEKVIETYKERFAKDEAIYNSTTEKLNNFIPALEAKISEQKKLLEQKQELIADFNAMMGPALREGYWQPEDYNDYGERHNVSYDLTNVYHRDPNYNSNDKISRFIWDTESFEGEQENGYEITVNESEVKYPCILLNSTLSATGTSVFDYIKNKLDQLVVIFYDYNVNIAAVSDEKLQIYKQFNLGSKCQLGFLKNNKQVQPVLFITGADVLSVETVERLKTNCKIGTISTTLKNNKVKIDTSNCKTLTAENWASDDMLVGSISVYPRIEINSLALKTSSDQLTMTYNDVELKQYEDYSILAKENFYTLTLKPETIIANGGFGKKIKVSYVISNADKAIYLDAIQVLKENSKPKVSYELEVNIVDPNFIKTDYDKIGYIVHINDNDLKFENVFGYISEVELDLDNPFNDKLEIKNYKTKFEDLFSTIVASTEAMKKNSYVIGLAAQAFTTSGELTESVITGTISKVNLNYAFNNGKLTINEKEGIWATSDSGVVAMRGGGIFTANQKDTNDNWIWNTGITPEGINASLITTGQLDTNRIKIYAGDRLRLQMNDKGLFAYKSFSEDIGLDSNIGYADSDKFYAASDAETVKGYDPLQYVKFDENGLALIAESGAQVLNSAKTEYLTVPNKVTRVEIGWDGLTLRNYAGKKTLYADADTGNLKVEGDITASNFVLNTGTITTSNGSQYNLSDLSSGTNIKKLTDIQKLYYLKTENPTDFPSGPQSKITRTVAISDMWTKMLPKIKKGSRLYSCNQYIYSNGNCTHGQVMQESSFSAMGSDLITAKEAAQAFTATGLFSNITWANKTYGLALTSAGNLLMGANNGITIVNTDLNVSSNNQNVDGDSNAEVVTINKDGIKMAANSIELYSSDGDSSFIINEDRVELMSGQHMAFNANNFYIDTRTPIFHLGDENDNFVSISSYGLILMGKSLELTSQSAIKMTVDTDPESDIDLQTFFTIDQNGITFKKGQTERNAVSIFKIDLNGNITCNNIIASGSVTNTGLQDSIDEVQTQVNGGVAEYSEGISFYNYTDIYGGYYGYWEANLLSEEAKNVLQRIKNGQEYIDIMITIETTVILFGEVRLILYNGNTQIMNTTVVTSLQDQYAISGYNLKVKAKNSSSIDINQGIQAKVWYGPTVSNQIIDSNALRYTIKVR